MEIEDARDVEPMDVERGEQTQAHSAAPATALPFSSSHRPLRVSRARYASSDSEGSPLPALPPRLPSPPTTIDVAIPSNKRTFSSVSTSSGFSPSTLAPPFFHSGHVVVASPPVSPRLSALDGSSSHSPSLELPLPSSSLALELAQHSLFRPATPLDPDPRLPIAQDRVRTHSFESQRASTARVTGRRNLLEVARESAEGGESSRNSSLRRRSPAVTETRGPSEGRSQFDGERGGSKRRRAATLLPGSQQDEGPAPTATVHQGTSSFAPALGIYPSQAQPVEPVLSQAPSPTTSSNSPDSLQFRSRHRIAFGLARGGLSLGMSSNSSSTPRHYSTVPDSSVETDERRTTSRHSFSRLPPWWRSSSSSQQAAERSTPLMPTESAAVGASSSFLSAAPLREHPSASSSSSSSSRPRTTPPDSLAAFACDEHVHSDESNRLHHETDAFLREAEQTLRMRHAILRDAEETTRQARRLLSQDREDRERERRISRLPNVGGLPEPAELSARPVIGLRIGEGWPATSSIAVPASPPVPTVSRRRRSSLFSSHSPPPLSPDEPTSDTPTTGGTSSRTRQFLTSLRSRRPRFLRNSTSATPPEIASPEIAGGFFGSPFDEEAERRAANDLNDRLLERRRISASLEPPAPAEVDAGRSGLWGETVVRTSRSRLRGPTEGQNERWRQGQAPAQAGGSTTPALVTSTLAGSSRFSPPSDPLTPANFLDTQLSFRSLLGVANNATDAAATAHFVRRDDSPSPRRRNQAHDFGAPPLLDTVGGPTNEAGSAGVTGEARAFEGLGTSTELGRMPSSDGPRLAIRLPLSTTSATPIASSSRARLELDDEDDDVPQLVSDDARIRHAGWNPPQLPLMLPSGSDGRRMVFSHPARAFGMSDSLEAAEEGRVPRTRDDHSRTRSESSSSGPTDPALYPVKSEPDQAQGGSRDSNPDHPGHLARGDDARFISRFDPFDDLPFPVGSTSTAEQYARLPSDSTANSRLAPLSTSLADSLSPIASYQRIEDLGARPSLPSTSTSTVPTLRRRHYGSLSNALDDAEPVPPLERAQDAADSVADRLAQHRIERLASLRRERTFMRGILGGTSVGATSSGSGGGGDGSASNNSTRTTGETSEPRGSRDRARDSLEVERERRTSAASASPPRSPGYRRRGLGDFFRGFGTGGRLISIFDEEYGAFFGRDAVALDSRNYLEDDEFDASYEGLLRLSAQIGDVKPKGASQDALAKLRTFPYSKWPYIEHSVAARDGVPVATTSAETLEKEVEESRPEFARVGVEKESRCAICLSDYEDEDEIALAHCSHGFHSECLRAWLKDHGSCPVCRRDHSCL
ncbi:hypothetical protein JCM11491_001884 [Sporobolomyces phaffii]